MKKKNALANNKTFADSNRSISFQVPGGIQTYIAICKANDIELHCHQFLRCNCDNINTMFNNDHIQVNHNTRPVFLR